MIVAVVFGHLLPRSRDREVWEVFSEEGVVWAG